MFIKNVPVVPGTTVLNDEIIYSDDILDYKKSCNEIILTSIDNVGEYSLETCIKIILEDNLDVKFINIQYSSSRKKVYFYTNKNICTYRWDVRVNRSISLVNDETTFKKLILDLFSNETDDYSDCISLYDIKELTSKQGKINRMINDKYINYIEKILRKDINARKVNELLVYNDQIVVNYYNNNYENSKIVFARKNKNAPFYYKESNAIYYDELRQLELKSEHIVNQLSEILPKLYDEISSRFYYSGTFCNDMKTLNSYFCVTFSDQNMNIYTMWSPHPAFKNFDLSLNYNDMRYYYSEKNSFSIISYIYGKEDKLLKRLLFRIDDCPAWSREILYQKRIEQLNDKHNRKKLIKTIFPWIKD